MGDVVDGLCIDLSQGVVEFEQDGIFFCWYFGYVREMQCVVGFGLYDGWVGYIGVLVDIMFFCYFLEKLGFGVLFIVVVDEVFVQLQGKGFGVLCVVQIYCEWLIDIGDFIFKKVFFNGFFVKKFFQYQWFDGCLGIGCQFED